MRPRLLRRFLLAALAVCACGHGTGKLDGMLTEGRLDDVLRETEKCLAETPAQLHCLAARAQALDRLGRLGEAAESWWAVLRVDPAHGEAWARLVHYADMVPAPATGVELIRGFQPPVGAVPEGRQAIWARRVAQADSIVAAATVLQSAVEWSMAIATLRTAVQTDGGRFEPRAALCSALLDAAARGEALTERRDPVSEALRLCDDDLLLPAVRSRLREQKVRAEELLRHEWEALAGAKTFAPWPGARFDAGVDSSSYYPRIQFRCDETKSADIALDFPAQSPQYTLVGERVTLLQYPRPGAPAVGLLKGTPSVIVLEHSGDYRLVSVGGLKGWVASGSMAEKHRFTAELRPRGSMELRVRPAMAHVRVDVNGMNVFRGEVDFKPYVSYRWSF